MKHKIIAIMKSIFFLVLNKSFIKRKKIPSIRPKKETIAKKTDDIPRVIKIMLWVESENP